MNNLETTVATTTETDRQQVVQTQFFAVSVTKLVVLSFCTLGVYPIYWFYINWKIIKEQEQVHILPFWRAIFSTFLAMWLLFLTQGWSTFFCRN